MRLPVFLALTFALSGPALSCPTAGDIDRGVVLVEEIRDMFGQFNTFHTHMRRVDDVVLASRRDPQLRADQWHTHDLGGILAVLDVRRSGADRALGTFSPEVEALFPLQPSQAHSFEGQWQIGDRIWRSVYALETGAMETVDLAGCTYDAFPFEMEEARTLPDGTISNSVRFGHYIPDLMLLRGPETEGVRVTDLRLPGFWESWTWPYFRVNRHH